MLQYIEKAGCSVQRFLRIKKMIGEISSFSKTVVMLGVLMMVCFYIVGFTAYIIAPYVPNYFGAMSVFRGSLEAAPASLASGMIAAFICDVALKSRR